MRGSGRVWSEDEQLSARVRWELRVRRNYVYAGNQRLEAVPDISGKLEQQDLDLERLAGGQAILPELADG